MGFTQFYQDGGFFMHVITVLGAIASGALVRSQLERRMAAARGLVLAEAPPLMRRLAGVIVMVGVLALLDGTVQLLNALATVSHDQWPQLLARGATIVLIPMGWALAVASAVLFADAMLGGVGRRSISTEPAA